jgi:hypothetical protein
MDKYNQPERGEITYTLKEGEKMRGTTTRKCIPAAYVEMHPGYSHNEIVYGIMAPDMGAQPKMEQQVSSVIRPRTGCRKASRNGNEGKITFRFSINTAGDIDVMGYDSSIDNAMVIEALIASIRNHDFNCSNNGLSAATTGMPAISLG